MGGKYIGFRYEDKSVDRTGSINSLRLALGRKRRKFCREFFDDASHDRC